MPSAKRKLSFAEERAQSSVGRAMSVEPRHPTLLQRLQLLARLKAHGLAGWNCDLGASAWIAANPGFARPHVENAEAPQLNALPVRKCSLRSIGTCFSGHFGLL